MMFVSLIGHHPLDAARHQRAAVPMDYLQAPLARGFFFARPATALRVTRPLSAVAASAKADGLPYEY